VCTPRDPSRRNQVVFTDHGFHSGHHVWKSRPERLFIGVSQRVSARLPEPWDSVAFVSGFTVALIPAVAFWVRSESRRHALRAWAESMNEPAIDRPPTLVLLSDGDEALLALKIAEGLNVMARGLWRAAFWLPSLMHAHLGRLGRWRLGLYGLLSLAALVFLVLRDAQSPWGPNPDQMWSFLLAFKFLAAAALVPLMLYVVSAFALAAPAMAAMLIGYPALTFSRWLAFGWGGSVGLDITAETCPLGTATITRLGTQPDVRGLRHAHWSRWLDDSARRASALRARSAPGAPGRRRPTRAAL
jgi:hypothetical protein